MRTAHQTSASVEWAENVVKNKVFMASGPSSSPPSKSATVIFYFHLFSFEEKRAENKKKCLNVSSDVCQQEEKTFLG